MQYKIFVPVVNQAKEFKEIVDQCPDKSKLIILNNYVNPQVEKYCQELEKEGVEVLRDPTNPGAAGSFNIGIAGPDRKWGSPMREGLDFVVHLSPSCIFDNDVNDFIQAVEDEESKAQNYYYWAPGPYKTDMQCFAVMRRCVEKAGLFDENFVPYSFEDTDYSRRMFLVGAHRNKIDIPRGGRELSLSLREPRLMLHYQLNAHHIHDYYVRKWGGEHTFEKFEKPFNNPNVDIREWYREEELITKLPEHA